MKTLLMRLPALHDLVCFSNRMSDVPEQQNPPCSTFATTLMPDKHDQNASDAVNMNDAVVTVPVNFDDLQRQTTKDAGYIYGMNVLRLINELTETAITYRLDIKDDGVPDILNYDTSGGALDVSRPMIEDGIFEEEAMAGDNGERETAVCGKFNKFNLESLYKGTL